MLSSTLTTLICSRHPCLCTKHPQLHILAFGYLALHAPALVCTLFCLCTCCQSIISTLIYFVLTFVFHLYCGFKMLEIQGSYGCAMMKVRNKDVHVEPCLCHSDMCDTMNLPEKKLRINHWNEVNEIGHVVVAKAELMSWQVENIAWYVLSLGKV